MVSVPLAVLGGAGVAGLVPFGAKVVRDLGSAVNLAVAALPEACLVATMAQVAALGACFRKKGFSSATPRVGALARVDDCAPDKTGTLTGGRSS